MLGQTDPNAQIEVSGSLGTNKALALLNDAAPDLIAGEDDTDYEDTSMYVAMVKDLAMTTAAANDTSKFDFDDDNGEVDGKNKNLSAYASAVAAKSNAIQQYAFDNVIEVIKYGGVAGFKEVDETVDDSIDDFEQGDDSQADVYGEQEESAVDDTGDDAQVTQVQGDTTGLSSFLWTMNLYSNSQYQPIDANVFAEWRKNDLDVRYGASFPIWALDYKGNIDVLSQVWKTDTIE